MIRLPLTALILVAFGSVQCRELLLDFLNFQESHPGKNLTEKCASDLRTLKEGIESSETWALKVFDTSGRPGVGFTSGNNFWLGRELACDMINAPREIPMTVTENRRMLPDLLDSASKIPVKYRMFYANHTSNVQFDTEMFIFYGLHIGLCFPDNCQESEIAEMAKNIFMSDEWQNSPYLHNVSFFKTKTLDLRKDFFREPLVVLLILFTLILIFLSTLGSLVTMRMNSRKKPVHEIKLPDNKAGVKKPKPSFAEMFWKGLAVQQNLWFIFSSPLPTDSLNSINGFRAAATLWIILSHIYLYAFGPIENFHMLFAYGDILILQPFYAALLAVDIFFVIAGFLMSYRFYELQKKQKSADLVVCCSTSTMKKILFRYIRLAPAFAMILLMAVVVGMFINDTSQFFMIEDLEGNCKRYWWRNLLMIQNWYPKDEMCMTWSWFIAADFQLFIAASILLALSVKHFKLSALIGCAMIVMSSIYCGYLGYFNSYNLSVTGQYHTADILYFPTYTRISSYFCGVSAGYYLSSINREWNISKAAKNIGWTLSIIVIVVESFMTKFGREDGFAVAVLFPAFGRLIWAMAVSFMLLATTTQLGNGSISKFWSAKVFVPLSRLSFCSYILNPLIIMTIVHSCQNSLHLNFYTIPIESVGYYCIINILAVVFTVLALIPVGHLIGLVL